MDLLFGDEDLLAEDDGLGASPPPPATSTSTRTRSPPARSSTGAGVIASRGAMASRPTAGAMRRGSAPAADPFMGDDEFGGAAMYDDFEFGSVPYDAPAVRGSSNRTAAPSRGNAAGSKGMSDGYAPQQQRQQGQDRGQQGRRSTNGYVDEFDAPEAGSWGRYMAPGGSQASMGKDADAEFNAVFGDDQGGDFYDDDSDFGFGSDAGWGAPSTSYGASSGRGGQARPTATRNRAAAPAARGAVDGGSKSAGSGAAAGYGYLDDEFADDFGFADETGFGGAGGGGGGGYMRSNGRNAGGEHGNTLFN